MGQLRQRLGKPYKSRAYLAWAKQQPGVCCICTEAPGVELHHFGDKGTGQKGTDLKVCRVCGLCHKKHQGKRRLAYDRMGDLDTWVAIQADGLELLCGYVEYLESLPYKKGG